MIWSIHSMGNHGTARFPQNAGVLVVLVLLVWGVFFTISSGDQVQIRDTCSIAYNQYFVTV